MLTSDLRIWNGKEYGKLKVISSYKMRLRQGWWQKQVNLSLRTGWYIQQFLGQQGIAVEMFAAKPNYLRPTQERPNPHKLS